MLNPWHLQPKALHRACRSGIRLKYSNRSSIIGSQISIRQVQEMLFHLRNFKETTPLVLPLASFELQDLTKCPSSQVASDLSPICEIRARTQRAPQASVTFMEVKRYYKITAIKLETWIIPLVVRGSLTKRDHQAGLGSFRSPHPYSIHSLHSRVSLIKPWILLTITPSSNLFIQMSNRIFKLTEQTRSDKHNQTPTKTTNHSRPNCKASNSSQTKRPTKEAAV